MKKNPLISVAIATYNGEKFLREQLDSIFNQTYKNIEVIVCDDCSSDSTVSIFEEYKSNFGLKYYINEKNLGFVKNFEKAISLCTGDFIALSDQDDVWNADKLEVLQKKISNYDLIYSDAEIINENGDVISTSMNKFINVEHYNIDQFGRLLLYSCYIYGCTMMFNSKLKDKILPFPIGLPYHDKWIALNAAENDRIKFESTSLMKYRLHGSNHSGVNDFSSSASKIKFYKNEELVYKKRSGIIDLIRISKNKFTGTKEKLELEKAEKYHKIMLNSRDSIFFKIYRLFFLIIFALRNKYLLDPETNYFIYFLKLTMHFFLSNPVTRKVYFLIRGNVHEN